MFFGNEMHEPCVWINWDDAFRTAMMIRSKMQAVVAPCQDWDPTLGTYGNWRTVGYGIVLLSDRGDPSKNSIATKGLIYALMQRHDAFEEREIDGKMQSVQTKPLPGLNALPFFSAMPKERPSGNVAPR